MRSLIQFGFEELQSFHGSECATCNQLRRGLKDAVMYAALCATAKHLQSPVTAQTIAHNAEVNLTYALKDFREHRRVFHAMNPVAGRWTPAARSAS